ncbi:MAG: hypothetical protein HY775_04075 [Acidobacteria bacterium]|nr:hypothetical protein [Acidobacteriota bacterium]
MVKKIAALLVLLLALGMVPLLAQADPDDVVCALTPAGKACVDPDEAAVAVDGAKTNPNPLDGYVVVYGVDGKICRSDNGGWDDDPKDPGETCQKI